MVLSAFFVLVGGLLPCNDEHGLLLVSKAVMSLVLSDFFSSWTFFLNK